MLDKVTDKVREAPPPSLVPAHSGTDGEKTAAHLKETERRGNVINESFSIPGVTKAILEHLQIQGSGPERAASTHLGTTDVTPIKVDRAAEARDRDYGEPTSGLGNVKQPSRRPPGGEGTQEISPSAQEALDRLVTTQRQMESNSCGKLFGDEGDDEHDQHDRNSGGQDVGFVSTEQDGYHLGFRQTVETEFVNLKLRQILDKFSNGPIGSTTFTHSEIESAFAIQSLTGHIVTNFQQEFASDRPSQPIGVDKLSITERDGRTLLTTPEGTALVNDKGKPVMATELGSYLHKDGTLMVDGRGHLSRPGDLQQARTTQQEHMTENHRKEAEKVRVRQQMQASLDSVSSRDTLAESMRSSRPELMQAIIDSAEQSVNEDEKERVNRTEALYLARRIMEDKEIDEIADAELEIGVAESENPDQKQSEDALDEPVEGDREESMGGDSQETDDAADYSQKEVLGQGQTAVLTQQGTSAAPDQKKPQQSAQQPQADPQSVQEPTESQVLLATIERVLTDLSGIVASASANYDRMLEAQRSAPPEPPDCDPQTDTLPLPAMPRLQHSNVESAQNSPYEHQSHTNLQVMYRTNIGEVISVSTAHIVTNMFY